MGVEGLPKSLSADILEDESFLVAMHNLLIDVHVEEGVLTCPESGRTFQIASGIPNLMIEEADVK